MKFKYRGWRHVQNFPEFQTPPMNKIVRCDRDQLPYDPLRDELYFSSDSEGFQIQFYTNFGQFRSNYLLAIDISYKELATLCSTSSRLNAMFEAAIKYQSVTEIIQATRALESAFLDEDADEDVPDYGQNKSRIRSQENDL